MVRQRPTQPPLGLHKARASDGAALHLNQGLCVIALFPSPGGYLDPLTLQVKVYCSCPDPRWVHGD